MLIGKICKLVKGMFAENLHCVSMYDKQNKCLTLKTVLLNVEVEEIFHFLNLNLREYSQVVFLIKSLDVKTRNFLFVLTYMITI